MDFKNNSVRIGNKQSPRHYYIFVISGNSFEEEVRHMCFAICQRYLNPVAKHPPHLLRDFGDLSLLCNFIWNFTWVTPLKILSIHFTFAQNHLWKTNCLKLNIQQF